MVVDVRREIYQIVHIDRLSSIVRLGFLYLDAEARRESIGGTAIGISSIKRRRPRMPLRSRQGLCVGDSVPSYFCPRSVMLYKANQGDVSFLEDRGRSFTWRQIWERP